MLDFFLIISITIVPAIGIVLSSFVIKNIIDLFTKLEIEESHE
jgi:hypothetical protein